MNKRNNQPDKEEVGEDSRLRNRNKKILKSGAKKRAIQTKVEEEINEVVNEVEEGDGTHKTEEIKIEANAAVKEAREVRAKEVVILDLEVEEETEWIGILIEEMMEDLIETEVTLALVIEEMKDRITEEVEGILAIKMEDTEEMAKMEEVSEVKAVGEGMVKVEVKVEAMEEVMEEVMEGEETTIIIEMTEMGEIIINKTNKIIRQPSQSL